MDCFKVNEYKVDEYTRVQWSVYGYTGHYSIYIFAYNGTSCQAKYRLPSQIDVNLINDVRAIIKDKLDDGYYFPTIKGFTITWGDQTLEVGTKQGTKVQGKPLPYETLALYRRIDSLLSLAKKLDVATDIGNTSSEFNVDKVYKLIDELDAALNNEFKLFKLMEGKGIADILNDLSKVKDELNAANSKGIELNKELIYVKDQLAYNISLVKAKEETETKLRAEITRLIEERESYKEKLLTRIKEAANNLK